MIKKRTADHKLEIRNWPESDNYDYHLSPEMFIRWMSSRHFQHRVSVLSAVFNRVKSVIGSAQTQVTPTRRSEVWREHIPWLQRFHKITNAVLKRSTVTTHWKTNNTAQCNNVHFSPPQLKLSATRTVYLIDLCSIFRFWLTHRTLHTSLVEEGWQVGEGGTFRVRLYM